MPKYCTECKQDLTFAERWGIRKHVCDEDILAALAYKAQEERKQYLERKRLQAERDAVLRAALRFKSMSAPYGAATPKPMRSTTTSSRRVSSSYDDDSMVTNFASSMSVYSSDSSSSYSSCDSSSSSSDSGSCSSGD